MNKNKNLTIEETFRHAVKNHQEGKIDIAQDFNSQILKIDPSHVTTLNNLGGIFQELGKKKAIEFSLNSDKYYDVESPKVLHQPKTGDIVIFPSSLHHRTIPFSADTDRISIAFDLLPNWKI